MISEDRCHLTTQIEYSGATPLCTIVDGYDPVGNRLTRNLDGNPITWTYDDLYRLTGQQKAGQVCTYTLDGVGNLKTMWEGGNFPKTFTWGAADRLVTMVEGASLTTYAWTGYGALESEITGNSTTGYAYNGQDQLAVVTEPSGDKTTYSFDGDGLRRSVATTNVNQDPPTLDVTTMVWDGSDYLLLNEPTQNRVVLTLDSEIVSCGSKDLLTDPLWPRQRAYEYVDGSPILKVDPTGLLPFWIIALLIALLGATCAWCAIKILEELADIDLGTQDKRKHCVMACMLRMRCGAACSALFVVGTEVFDLICKILGGDCHPSLDDVAANLAGFVCGSLEMITTCIPWWFISPRNWCESCCASLNYGGQGAGQGSPGLAPRPVAMAVPS